MENSIQIQLIGLQFKVRRMLHNGQWIWKLDIFPRIMNFIWLCLHGSIPVKEVLADRGINCVRLCPICREQDESILHLLHDCVYAHD